MTSGNNSLLTLFSNGVFYFSQVFFVRMTDWGGFSEAELRHLRSGGDSSPPKPKTAPKTATTPKSNPKKALAARKTTKPKSQKKDQAMLPTKQKPESEPVETQDPPEMNVRKWIFFILFKPQAVGILLEIIV